MPALLGHIRLLVRHTDVSGASDDPRSGVAVLRDVPMSLAFERGDVLAPDHRPRNSSWNMIAKCVLRPGRPVLYGSTWRRHPAVGVAVIPRRGPRDGARRV